MSYEMKMTQMMKTKALVQLALRKIGEEICPKIVSKWQFWGKLLM